MTANPLALLFEGADEVVAEMRRREEAGGPDHPADAWGDLEPLHPRRLDLTVAEVIDETVTTKTFRLRKTDGGRCRRSSPGSTSTCTSRSGTS